MPSKSQAINGLTTRAVACLFHKYGQFVPAIDDVYRKYINGKSRFSITCPDARLNLIDATPLTISIPTIRLIVIEATLAPAFGYDGALETIR